jgi:myo-inositol-1(or 4)-monophosphatase
VRDIRRMGSAALDLCAVAEGRLDGYFERGLNPWDVSAGSVIAREAGASVDIFDDGLVVASAPSIHRALLELVR